MESLCCPVCEGDEKFCRNHGCKDSPSTYEDEPSAGAKQAIERVMQGKPGGQVLRTGMAISIGYIKGCFDAIASNNNCRNKEEIVSTFNAHYKIMNNYIKDSR